MGLKILHTADWHLGSPFTGFPPEQRQFLINALETLPGKLADLCRREDCQLMLIAGDLFDSPTPDPDTVAAVAQALARCAVPVFITPGNHDYCAPGSPWLEVCWPENVHIFTGALDSVTLEALDCRIYGGGFRSMDCPALLEGFQAEGQEKYHIGLFHGDPTQAASPCNPITAAQVRNSGLQYLALGHIHKAGTFRSGSTLCAWPGCPMGRGWDELGDKGACIVTLGDSVQVQAVSLGAPRFLEISVEIGTDAAAALEAALPAMGSHDFYRIHLTGEGTVDPDRLRSFLARFSHLQLLDETHPPMDLWARAGEDTLEGVYFQLLKTALEEDPANAPQIRLAAEISRRLLDGKEVRL